MSTERLTGDFGKTLREARERRGVTLRQIANTTKISVSQLEALERNDISRLPGGIFSRGIVRSYATEIGLDPEATIHDFIAHFSHDEAVTAGHPTSEQNEDNEALESDRRMAGTFIWLIGISLPVAGAVLYFGTVGRQVAAVAPKLTTQTRAVESAPVEALPAAVTPEPTPVQRAAPEPAATPARPADPPAPATTVEDRLTVGLSVKRPCWVSATVDGRRAIERLLQAGTQTTLDVRRELVLTTGDAAALSVTLNGADAKPLGKSGEVVTTRFTLANFKEYLQVR
ncbi:MAG: DUF4115 domain-containing protein [Acidobacteria bacterium]|nr:DUF4115 domain-containing protein [Acidobacteriota bacterium]